MKKIKKLTLNKEVISILCGNEMNMVKGGTYLPSIGQASCPDGICTIGGDTLCKTCPATCPATCPHTCQTCLTQCVTYCGTCQQCPP